MPQLAPASQATAGLFTRTNTDVVVPLTGVAVDVDITGLCARVSVAHRYVNRETTPIEAVYVFPLDEGAAVCGFEAVIDGTVIVGEVLERDKAFERYDEALERGDGGFLLDEERPDVFQASIGNLAPGAEVLVRIAYVTELAVDDGQLRFTLPTTLAPRYAPVDDRHGVGRSDAETLNPPVEWSVPYGLDLVVRVAMPGGVRGLNSPSHPVSIDLADGRAIVRLAAREAALDRDFVLMADAAALASPRAYVEEHRGERAIAVAFSPRFDVTPAATEVVFVVDRSGSMEGDSIAEVRNALQLCLRSLTTDCAFNIVGFGSTFASLFPTSRAYDQASLDEATRHVQSMSANLGGTELAPALKFALEQPPHAGLPRQVIVLTDGEVTNTDAVIALAAGHHDRVRVFTLGIGMAASQHLVRGLARAGRGSAEFIHPGERIESKVLRLFGRVLSPALTDVRVDWIGGDVTTAARNVPAVFTGQQLLIYGLVGKQSALPGAVRVSALQGNRPVTWDVEVPGAVESGAAVVTLAARARIRELEESPEWIGGRGSRQHGRRESAVQQQIIDLAIRHGLLSRETSYVAIERRETPIVGDMQLRRVPVALASGWGGLQRPVPTRVVFGRAASPPAGLAPRIATLQSEAVTRLSALFSAGDADESSELIAPQLRSVPDVSFRRAPARPRELDALVAMQRADGSWDLDNALAGVLRRTFRDLEQSMPHALGHEPDGRRAWATALALAWLEAHAHRWQDEWHRLAEKATVWLRMSGAAGEVEAVWRAASAVMTP